MEDFRPGTTKIALPGRRWHIAALVMAWLAGMGLLAAVFSWVPRETQRTRQSVEHTQVVLLTAQRLLLALEDAETGQRGYLLTSDVAYLQPYQQGTAKIPALLADLHALTNENARQEGRLAELDRLIAAKSDELANTVGLMRAGDSNAAVARVRTDIGKGYMDMIRQILSATVSEEERLLVERRAAEQAADWRLNIMLSLLLLFLLGLLMAATAIAIRSAMQALRRENEAQFRTLADWMPTLCWMANPEGWIFWYNRGWFEYTGTTFEQMQGWAWQSVHDPAVLPQVLLRWKDSIATAKPFEMTFPLKGADGTFRPFLTRVIPLYGPDGAVIRWFGTNTDITEERRGAETLERLVEERTAALLREVEERRAAEDMLRQTEKLHIIGQLTGGIAHDFNNVLQVISGGVLLLKSQRVSDAQREVLLNGMERAARNAAEMVGRLLAFARRQALMPTAFDLNERLRGMSSLLSHTLGSQIVLTMELAPDLWPVLADPNQLEVAVLNLAINARDAMQAGGTLTLATSNGPAHQTPDYVYLVVRDTGVGMPPAVRARIFEPFFTTKEVGKGSGLGLPQVQGFAKQSGGDLIVMTEAGKGTEFTLCLPRASDQAAGAGAAASGMPASQSALSGEAIALAIDKVVLVVDDNPDVGAFAATMLEGLGYTVQQARNAPDALARLDAGQRVDAVFSDVVMPGGIDGAELASILGIRYPSIAVVLATGYSDHLDRLREVPVEVLAKPYRLDELAPALERALKKIAAEES